MGHLLGAALLPFLLGGRSETPVPKLTLFLTQMALDSQGHLSIPVSDALEVRVSQEPNGLLHGFSHPATSRRLLFFLSLSPSFLFPLFQLPSLSKCGKMFIIGESG